MPEITLAARRVNERQPAEIASFLASFSKTSLRLPPAPRIAVLGVAFKGQPETDDVRGTTAIALRSALSERFPNATFTAYDPISDAELTSSLGFEPAASLENGIRARASRRDPQQPPGLRPHGHRKLAALMARPAAIYDCWSNFIEQPMRMPNDVCYIALGNQGRPIGESDWSYRGKPYEAISRNRRGGVPRRALVRRLLRKAMPSAFLTIFRVGQPDGLST